MTSKSKTKLIKELQGYNKELGKHMPKVDFEKAINLKGALESSNQDDYYSLLATNFVELRTEVALLRKNLSNDIESMVVREVSEIQNRFFKQLSDFSGKIIFDIKENLGTYVQELNNNVLDIKREFNKISTKNELIGNRFDELKENSLDFKSYVEKLEYIQNNAFKHLNGEIEKIHLQNSTTFTKVVDRLNSEIRTSREAFRRLGLEVAKSHGQIRKDVGVIREMKEKPIFIDTKAFPKIPDSPEIEKFDMEQFKEIPDFTLGGSSSDKDKITEEVESFEEEQEEPIGLNLKKNEKLLEIDKRIKILQNLR